MNYELWHCYLLSNSLNFEFILNCDVPLLCLWILWPCRILAPTNVFNNLVLTECETHITNLRDSLHYTHSHLITVCCSVLNSEEETTLYVEAYNITTSRAVIAWKLLQTNASELIPVSGYIVNVKSKQDKAQEKTVNTSVHLVAFENLKTFTNYCVTVEPLTVLKGLGRDICYYFTTDDDSKFAYLLWWLIFLRNLIFFYNVRDSVLPTMWYYAEHNNVCSWGFVAITCTLATLLLSPDPNINNNRIFLNSVNNACNMSLDL